jgi:hypothetical protein
VNIFWTSAWLIPQRRPSRNVDRFPTCGASPFGVDAFPVVFPPPGLARLSWLPLELEEEDDEDERELLPEAELDDSSVGSGGSGRSACFGGTFGPQARTKANEPRSTPRFMDEDGITRRKAKEDDLRARERPPWAGV